MDTKQEQIENLLTPVRVRGRAYYSVQAIAFLTGRPLPTARRNLYLYSKDYIEVIQPGTPTRNATTYFSILPEDLPQLLQPELKEDLDASGRLPENTLNDIKERPESHALLSQFIENPNLKRDPALKPTTNEPTTNELSEPKPDEEKETATATATILIHDVDNSDNYIQTKKLLQEVGASDKLKLIR